MEILAVTASPAGLFVAFGAGILSFVSPCVLPLVPGYLSLISGGSATDAPGRHLRRALGFVAGFTVVFVALGATASGLGTLLHAHRDLLDHVAGGVIVALGGVLLLGSLPASWWNRLGARFAGAAALVVGEHRLSIGPGLRRRVGPLATPLAGMAFAFAWTPCIGPVLGSIVALSADRATLVGGVVLLLAYALGLGLPFIALGIAAGRAGGFLRRLRRFGAILNLFAGAILVAFGILLLAGRLGWLADQCTRLLDDLGLHRLTTS